MLPLELLSHYKISPTTGFMGNQPLKRLPSYFEPWESLLDNLSHWIVSWKYRREVLKLPLLDVDNLKEEAEWERAFLVLSLLSHAWVWGAKGENIKHFLPKVLSEPWLKVSHHLGMLPISCHAALVYYNWKLLNSKEGLQLDNLATLHTVSGGMDESWFYLITMAIELKGAEAIMPIMNCFQQIVLHKEKKVDQEAMLKDLKVIKAVIDVMLGLLKRMIENCDPYIFYHRVRIYFSGWTYAEYFPTGLKYESDTGLIENLFFEQDPELFHLKFKSENNKPIVEDGKRYAGGSAAQSVLIHLLDVFLGIQHQETGKEKNFMREMRMHMPMKYRHFLRHLEQYENMHQFLSNNSVNQEIVKLYNECVGGMKRFRDFHIQIVTRYILIPARKAHQSGLDKVEGEGYHGVGPKSSLDDLSTEKEMNGEPIKTTAIYLETEEVTKMPSNDKDGFHKGTGGTEIIPFLKQTRDETKDCLLK